MSRTESAARAVRHRWMFRTAAIILLFFGAVWIWRFGFTDYHPEQRPFGLPAGALALVVGVFVWKLRRWAIGVSAVAAAVVGISAAVFAPASHGPAILLLAGLALICILYTALALRTALASANGLD
jgi:peptidoglycan/LPS O-acetylase OafA/YrhL